MRKYDELTTQDFLAAALAFDPDDPHDEVAVIGLFAVSAVGIATGLVIGFWVRFYPW